tara:strand:+ start:731 stop:1936 length:1206 start_codon:yes stop_codon:yes gene_type:complete
MAVGTKFGSLAVANTLGQFRTDHNELAEELSFLANTTGVNHVTSRILSIKKTANVTANATVSGALNTYGGAVSAHTSANTRFLGNNLLVEANTKFSGGTVSIGGATLQATIALGNTNARIATEVARTTLVNTNLIGTNTALRLLINDRAQVANVAALAALANTNSSIAVETARVTLVNTNLVGSNTALRLLIADRAQVANVAALAALGNTNARIATEVARTTLVNTNLVGTNTALRLLIADRMQVANTTLLVNDRMQVANAATKVAPVFTGSVGIGNSAPAANLHVQGTFIAAQGMPIRKSGGNNITLALTDNGKLIRCINTASAVNIHIPAYDTVGMPLGSEISFVNELTHASANTLGFSNAAGVTLLSKELANTVADRFTSATLKKLEENTWILIGNLT